MVASTAALSTFASAVPTTAPTTQPMSAHTGGAIPAGAATPSRLASAAPTTAPTTHPMSARDAAIMADLKRVSGDLNRQLSAGTLTDPAKRAAAAPAAIPLAKQELALARQYASEHEHDASATSLAPLEKRLNAELYLLGDKETVDRVDARAAVDSEDGVNAKAEQLSAKWLGIDRKDAEAQRAFADELEKQDLAHTDNDALTAVTISVANTSGSAAVRKRMGELALKTMTSPTALAMAERLKVAREGDATLKGMVGKPVDISGTTDDGKPFSVSDYRGKVVLVDFWATWCGPCKAELPHVKTVYGKYHDQGLEVVGVSCDFSVDALRKFTPQNDMPWVELFDARNAAEKKLHPLAVGFGIHGIPVMFLIDKKGLLRSITARAEMDQLIPKLLAE